MIRKKQSENNAAVANMHDANTPEISPFVHVAGKRERGESKHVVRTLAMRNAHWPRPWVMPRTSATCDKHVIMNGHKFAQVFHIREILRSSRKISATDINHKRSSYTQICIFWNEKCDISYTLKSIFWILLKCARSSSAFRTFSRLLHLPWDASLALRSNKSTSSAQSLAAKILISSLNNVLLWKAC